MSYVGHIRHPTIRAAHITVHRSADVVVIDCSPGKASVYVPHEQCADLARHILNVAAEIQHDQACRAVQKPGENRSRLQFWLAHWRQKLRNK